METEMVAEYDRAKLVLELEDARRWLGKAWAALQADADQATRQRLADDLDGWLTEWKVAR